MKIQWMIGTAGLLVGAAGGYLAGKGDSQAKAIAEPLTMETKTVRGGSSGKGNGGGGAAEPTKRTRSLDDIYREPGQMSRIQALIDRFANMSPEQFAEEAKKLESLDMSERIMSSYLLFSRWAEVAPQEAMGQANKMGFAGFFIRPTVLQSWASTDPAGAAQFVADNPRDFAMMGGFGGRGGPGGGQAATAIIAGEWAKQDPTSALAWAQSLQSDRGQAVSSVLRQVALTDPRKAADLVNTIPAEERGRSYESIASSWATKNWSEAESWVKSLPVDEQGDAMAAAVRGLAGTDAVAASKQVGSIPEGGDRNRAIESVVENWSREDPAAAASWLMTQSNPEAQRESMRNLMSNWAQTDGAAAQAFIQGQPAGEVRDSAVSSYVWSNRDANPQQAMQLAESIQDEGSRNRTVGMAAMRWMREDQAAAKTYIEQSTSLDQEAKTRLLEGRFDRPRGNRGGPPAGGGAPPAAGGGG